MPWKNYRSHKNENNLKSQSIIDNKFFGYGLHSFFYLYKYIEIGLINAGMDGMSINIKI